MREVLFRVRRLISHRRVLAWWTLIAVAGVACTWLPLLNAPGYELSEALALVLTFLGGGLGVAGARKEDRVAPLVVLQLSAVLPALIVAVLRTWLGTPCDPFVNVVFVPLIVLPSAWLVAALSRFIARACQRWWTATLGWLGLILLSAISTTWPIVFGPQVFAFNHLAGYLPGPLYDESLPVTPGLLFFRAATICLALAFSAPRKVIGLIGLLCFFGLELNGVSLGFRMTDSALSTSLGGVIETRTLIIHYPIAYSDEELERLVGDVEFRHHQIVQFFGAEPSHKSVIWWYRTPEEKQRLVGAAHTQFAKPWRHEVHVNALGFPHPVIKHELVHAIAADWGSKPFGVAASFFGLAPHAGVIEGFAVAADNPLDELTLHEWAAAMKKKGLLPDVAKLMSADGFYGAPPSRAYTTAGSFLRWLEETRGKEKLRELYAHGDFEEVYPVDLATLVQAYEVFLDGVPLEPAAVNQAFGRFRRGSLFDRPCAREVSKLAEEAAALVEDQPWRAQEIISRCREIQPDEPSHVLAQVNLLRRLHRTDEACAMLDGELIRLKDEPSSWIDAAMARADLAVTEKDEATARTLFEQILQHDPPPAIDRTAHVRLEGGPGVQPYFAPGGDDVKIYELSKAEQTPYVRYLLGRKLAQAHRDAEALAILKTIGGEVSVSVQKEIARLEVEAAVGALDCNAFDHVGRYWNNETHQPEKTSDARADEGAQRCEFESARRLHK